DSKRKLLIKQRRPVVAGIAAPPYASPCGYQIQHALVVGVDGDRSDKAVVVETWAGVVHRARADGGPHGSVEAHSSPPRFGAGFAPAGGGGFDGLTFAADRAIAPGRASHCWS